MLEQLRELRDEYRRKADAEVIGGFHDGAHHAFCVALGLAAKETPILLLLRRIELLRACNLHTSERHPDRIQRERCAGAADCCARLLASFAPVEEDAECSAE